MLKSKETVITYQKGELLMFHFICQEPTVNVPCELINPQKPAKKYGTILPKTAEAVHALHTKLQELSSDEFLVEDGSTLTLYNDYIPKIRLTDNSQITISLPNPESKIKRVLFSNSTFDMTNLPKDSITRLLNSTFKNVTLSGTLKITDSNVIYEQLNPENHARLVLADSTISNSNINAVCYDKTSLPIERAQAEDFYIKNCVLNNTDLCSYVQLDHVKLLVNSRQTIKSTGYLHKADIDLTYDDMLKDCRDFGKIKANAATDSEKNLNYIYAIVSGNKQTIYLD